MPENQPCDSATLLEAIRNREATCGVIGLGFIGTTIMDGLLQAGFPVLGCDRLPEVVARTKDRYRWAVDRAAVSDTIAFLADCQVVVVAVRTLLLPDGQVNLEPLEAVTAALSNQRVSPRLILVATTLPPGETRAFAQRLKDQTHGTLYVVHSPERLSVGHGWQDMRRIPHLVGGLDESSSALGVALLSQICDTVVPVSAPEVSELSKLYENAFLSVGIALATEIERLSHALKLDAMEVCRAAATKSLGYYPFYPGAGIGGHCLPNDLKILLASARQHIGSAPLLSATQEVAELPPKLLVDRLITLAKDRGICLEGGSVLMVGVGFKVGCADLTETPAREVARLLWSRGMDPVYVDCLVPQFLVDGQSIKRLEPEEIRVRRFRAVVVLSGDSQVRAEDLEASADLVLDGGGARNLAGYPKSFLQL